MDYVRHLGQVLSECNPANNSLIANTALFFFVIQVALSWGGELTGGTAEEVPLEFLGFLIVQFVAVAAAYSAFGYALEQNSQAISFAEKLRTTAFIFTRPTGFFFLNLFALIGAFFLTVQPLHDRLVGDSGIPQNTFLSEAVLQFGNPLPVIVLGLLWLLFPKWAVWSIPAIYDKGLYTNDIAAGVRRAIVPATLFFAIVYFVIGAYDFGIERLFGDTDTPMSFGQIVLSSVSSVVFVFALAVALVAVARSSGLSDAQRELVRQPPAVKDPVDYRAAASKKMQAWKLIPYTDGRFVFYPGSRWEKGYILSSEQAEEYLGVIEKRGISFGQFLLICSVAGVAGSQLGMFGESSQTVEFIGSGWFILLAVVLVVLVHVVDTRIRTRKLKSRFGELPVCVHLFPSNYFRLRTLIVGFFSVWLMTTFVIFFGALLGILVYVIVENGLQFLNAAILVGGLICLFAAGVYLRLLGCQIRFRRLNGRRPNASDLGPIDPVTGQMAKDPFAEPM